MTLLSALGEFPEMILGLAFSFGCALLLAFVCLKFLVSLMTRQQYNVTIYRDLTNVPNLANDLNQNNDPSHTRSILWLGAAVAGSADNRTDPGSNDGGDSATGGPHLLPAAAPLNRFARDSKLNITSSTRVVELPQFVAERVAQGGSGDGWAGDNGGAA
jgi:hypothetical protein